MSYVLAIDVGTSFTAAAIARTDRIAPPVPESLPLGLRGTSVPSVIYYPEEGPILVGESAERRGLDSPDRVVREFKRRIGDNVPIALGTLSLPAEEVFATMAGWVVDRAAEREGEPPSQIILSHPAAWGGHRIAVIQEALTARGLNDVMLVSEPEAAALHYASQVRVEDGSTIAVYDLGGGTFDTAILKKADAGRFEFLGRPEGIEGLGGADFDAAVLRHVAAHTGEAITALDPADPAAMAALARLRRECVEAKEALSADSEASISVFLPAVHQQVRLVRSELEAMIEEPIRETVDALERSLDELGLAADDLTAVLLIGGSSRIPLVAQLISEQLDRPIAVDADPKSSICLGAVVAALRARQVAVVSAVTESSVTAIALTTIALTNVEPHGDNRRASWSRKPGAAFGSLAGTGDLTVGARGHSGAHAGAHAPGAKAGQHSPRPTVRLTAVAAAAAMLTVLTATTAQSPVGLGSLSAMFSPPGESSANGSVAAAADPGGPAPAGVGAAGAAGGAAGGAQAPLRGLEASARKSTDQLSTTAGFEVAASPTSRPSDSTPAAGSAGSEGAVAAGTTPGGTEGAPSDPAQGTGGSGISPETTTTDPDPTTDPVPDPTTDPVPDPTTDPPAPDPTTDPVPDPDPTTPAPDPDPTTPAPDPDPTTPAPDPTTPAPDPDPTTPAPDPTTPAPDPTTEPPAPTADPVPFEPVI
ncbi:Hsp70 family protein [Arthrobacter sp. S39]|nr:Hsp70 family protein [Arthrobacter sp. S39]TAP41119.1 Hsp70 family protein [Arthrobacter sp. S39]